jgi:GNAT superfamily N-acetyltransferase
MDAAAQNVAEPGLPPPTWIAVQGDQVRGYVTTLPIRLWDGQRTWPAYWIKGLMVLPQFRNGPIGFALLKSAVARLPRAFALAVAPAARRLFTALGFTDLGAIPNWLRPIGLGRMLRRLDVAELSLSGIPRRTTVLLRTVQRTAVAPVVGWVAGGVMRVAAAALRFPATRLEAGRFDPGDRTDELELLWESARADFPAAVVRDSRYLLARYGGRASPYVWVGARRNGRLSGIAILRTPRPEGDPRLRGIRVAALADLLYSPRDRLVGLALMGAVEGAARAHDADALLATCSAPVLQRLLRHQCYWPLPGNVHFLSRDASGEPTAVERSLADWWLTRGDGYSDEIF